MNLRLQNTFSLRNLLSPNFLNAADVQVVKSNVDLTSAYSIHTAFKNTTLDSRQKLTLSWIIWAATTPRIHTELSEIIQNAHLLQNEQAEILDLVESVKAFSKIDAFILSWLVGTILRVSSKKGKEIDISTFNSNLKRESAFYDISLDIRAYLLWYHILLGIKDSTVGRYSENINYSTVHSVNVFPIFTNIFRLFTRFEIPISFIETGDGIESSELDSKASGYFSFIVSSLWLEYFNCEDTLKIWSNSAELFIDNMSDWISEIVNSDLKSLFESHCPDFSRENSNKLYSFLLNISLISESFRLLVLGIEHASNLKKIYTSICDKLLIHIGDFFSWKNDIHDKFSSSSCPNHISIYNQISSYLNVADGNIKLALELGLFRADIIPAFTSIISEQEIELNWEIKLEDSSFTSNACKRVKKTKEVAPKNDKKKLQLYQSILLQKLESIICYNSSEVIKNKNEVLNTGSSSWVLIPILFSLFLDSAESIYKTRLDIPNDNREKVIYPELKSATISNNSLSTLKAAAESFSEKSLASLVFLVFSKFYSMLSGALILHLIDFKNGTYLINKQKLQSLTDLISQYSSNQIFGIQDSSTFVFNDLINKNQLDLVNHWSTTIICPFVRLYISRFVNDKLYISDASDSDYTLEICNAFQTAISADNGTLTFEKPNFSEFNCLSTILYFSQIFRDDQRFSIRKLVDNTISALIETRQLDVLLSCLADLIDNYKTMDVDFYQVRANKRFENNLKGSWFIYELSSRIASSLPSSLIPEVTSYFLNHTLLELKLLSNGENYHKKAKSRKKKAIDTQVSSKYTESRLQSLVLLFSYFISGSALASNTSTQDKIISSQLKYFVGEIYSKLVDLAVVSNSKVAKWSYLLIINSVSSLIYKNSLIQTWFSDYINFDILCSRADNTPLPPFSGSHDFSYPSVLALSITNLLKLIASTASKKLSYEHIFENPEALKRDELELNKLNVSLEQAISDSLDYIGIQRSCNRTENLLLKSGNWDGLFSSISEKNSVTAFYKIFTDNLAIITDSISDCTRLFNFVLKIVISTQKTISSVQVFSDENLTGDDESGLKNTGLSIANVTENLLSNKQFYENGSIRNFIVKNFFEFILQELSQESLQSISDNSMSTTCCKIRELIDDTLGYLNNKDPSDKGFDSLSNKQPKVSLSLLLSRSLDFSTELIRLAEEINTSSQSQYFKSLEIQQFIDVLNNVFFILNGFPETYLTESHIWTTVPLAIMSSYLFMILHILDDKNDLSNASLNGLKESFQWIYKCLKNRNLKITIKNKLTSHKGWILFLKYTLDSCSSPSSLSRTELIEDMTLQLSSIMLFVFQSNLNFQLNKKSSSESSTVVWFLNLYLENEETSKIVSKPRAQMLIAMLYIIYKDLVGVIEKPSLVLSEKVAESTDSNYSKEIVDIRLIKDIYEILNTYYDSRLENLDILNLKEDSFNIGNSTIPITLVYIQNIQLLMETAIRKYSLDTGLNEKYRLNTRGFSVTKVLSILLKRCTQPLNPENGIDTLSKSVLLLADLCLPVNFLYKSMTSIVSGELDSVEITQKESHSDNVLSGNMLNNGTCNIEEPIKLLSLNIFVLSSLLDLKYKVAFSISDTASNEQKSRLLLEDFNPSFLSKYSFASNYFNIAQSTKTNEIESIIELFLDNSTSTIFGIRNFDVDSAIGLLFDVIFDTRSELQYDFGSLSYSNFDTPSSSRVIAVLKSINKFLDHMVDINKNKHRGLFSSLISNALHFVNNFLVYSEEASILLETLLLVISKGASIARLSPENISQILDILFQICTRPLLYSIISQTSDFSSINHSKQKASAEKMFSSICKVLSNCFLYYPGHIIKCIPSAILLIRSFLHLFVEIPKGVSSKNQNAENLFNYSPLSDQMALEFSRLAELFVSIKVDNYSAKNPKKPNINTKSRSLKSARASRSVSASIISKYAPLVLAEYCIIMGGGLIELDSRSKQQLPLGESSFQQETENSRSVQPSLWNNINFEATNDVALGNLTELRKNYTLHFASPIWRPIQIQQEFSLSTPRNKKSLISDQKTYLTDSDQISENFANTINENTETFDEIGTQNRNIVYGIVNHPDTRSSLCSGLYAILDIMSEVDRNALMQSFGKHEKPNEVLLNKNTNSDIFSGFYNVSKTYKNKRDKTLVTVNSNIPANWSGAREALKSIYRDYLEFYKFKGDY
ncbi:hypothetical protein BB560_000135 [Smittium megazygosporum]|uniref:Nucleolar 27S pre-rRNA processing Urb2/Npa2 C-terminal domain-containing protein n=1 Tax=Smittium megazygosporum TaxID=133381 RepID=A0A2T9ZL89_9FUNG|nr:hypothetical protein BB560_000135 [Smittium megazygosporum]